MGVMMSKSKNLMALLLVSAAAASAQKEVARVTASASFMLRGALITPGQGVTVWPVLAGDDVTAGTSPTSVTFPDGSALTLAPASEAKVDFVNGKPVFQLISGNAPYSLKSTSSVQLMVGAKTTTVEGLTGTLKVDNDQKVAAETVAGTAAGVGAAGGAGGLSTGAVIGIVGGVAGAGGAAYEIKKAVSSGPPVSGHP
jgi:ferric-dicitrate binding protein FerR (iron transport regulator)